METTILMIALVVEAAFAAYCVITKTNQERLRSLFRIGALAAFIIFTLVSVIEWGFRWYGLAALLLVWAALGTWTLMRPAHPEAEHRPARIVLAGISELLLVAILMVPALIFPQHKLPRVTGTDEVATASYTYTDQSRVETFTNTGENRKVNVEFWYPKDAGGKYPLVVFSHGTGGVKTSNTSTFRELASNGYVVCSIDHPYHSMFTIGSDGHVVRIDPSYLQEYMNLNNGTYDEETKFWLEQKWIKLRTADISFVLDTILAEAKGSGSDPVYRIIDTGKIGLMGHSLGGESSAQVARERNDVDAVVNLDADLAGEYLDFVNGQRVMNDKVYPVPILTIFSDPLVRLIDAVPDAKDVVAVMHVSATAPQAFQVHLKGTDHLSLTDLSISSPFLVSLIDASVPKGAGREIDPLATIERMNAIVLEFFDVYLKGQGSFTAPGD